MQRAEHRIRAVDGRLLSVLTVGSPQGDHVFFLHGTPGVREIYGPHIEEIARRGLIYDSYSRPGYGGSDRHPGREIADCAADIAAIADQIGAETFYLIGESGGGPHALACAPYCLSEFEALRSLGRSRLLTLRNLTGKRAWVKATAKSSEQRAKGPAR